MLLRASGVVIGLLLGLVATRLADMLPKRYGITHLASGAKRKRRNVVVAAIIIDRNIRRRRRVQFNLIFDRKHHARLYGRTYVHA